MLYLRTKKFTKWMAQVLLLGLVGGCAVSFQSTQYNALKTMLSPKTVILPSWQLRWLGIEKKLYPVNLDKETLFTDGDVLEIYFDGWNVTRVEGLMAYRSLMRSDQGRMSPLNQVIASRVLQDGLILTELNRVQWAWSSVRYAEWYCSDWQAVTDGPQDYQQICYSLGENYRQAVRADNLIGLNDAGLIDYLEFSFDPAVTGAVRLELL